MSRHWHWTPQSGENALHFQDGALLLCLWKGEALCPQEAEETEEQRNSLFDLKSC